MDNITIITKEYDLNENLSKINLDNDLVFSFTENSPEELNFDFSGTIRMLFNNPINLTTLPKSPLRPTDAVWIYSLNMKFSCPMGIIPKFEKHNTTRSVSDIYFKYDQYVDVKIKHNKKTLKSHSAIIYHNLKTEISYNLACFKEYDNSTMIFPNKFNIFDLNFVRSMFSSNPVGNIWVIRNNEFYNNFKEIKQ